MFGKNANNIYYIDIQYPLTPFVGLAIAIPQLDTEGWLLYFNTFAELLHILKYFNISYLISPIRLLRFLPFSLACHPHHCRGTMFLCTHIMVCLEGYPSRCLFPRPIISNSYLSIIFPRSISFFSLFFLLLLRWLRPHFRSSWQELWYWQAIGLHRFSNRNQLRHWVS